VIFRRNKPPDRPATGIELVERLVDDHLPEADADTRTIVVGIAGLLASVAYADRSYDDAEQLHVREALGRIHALPAAGADAICDALKQHLLVIAATNPQRHTRALRELAEPELRQEVLEALVDLAAADGELAMTETDLLRRTAGALGLDQNAYVLAQARHRERLSVLKR
jgi:uncharacterized tellurite resistance protein B-like protein